MEITEKTLLIDLDYCIGCRSCSAACHYSHYNHSTMNFGWIREDAFLPFLCRHCEEASCVKACPQKAMERGKDGIVRRNNALCIGCRSCIYACPFGVIASDLKAHIISKCDLCLKELAVGRVPVCVATCSSGALKFGSPSGLGGEKGLNIIGARLLSHNVIKRR